MPRDIVLKLHLADPKELFVFDPTTYDPFDPDALGESGIDYLLQQVPSGWRAVPPLCVTIFLPASKMAPGIEQRMRCALRTYCEQQLAANRRARAEFWSDNALFLAIAIVIVAVGLWLQPRIAAATWISSQELKDALQTGILVVIWVVFWTPISGFVLEWVPFARTRRRYRALLAADVTVRPDDRTG